MSSNAVHIMFFPECTIISETMPNVLQILQSFNYFIPMLHNKKILSVFAAYPLPDPGPDSHLLRGRWRSHHAEEHLPRPG